MTLILACLWVVVITQTGFVCSDIHFIERQEGQSVVLPCVVDERNPSPFGVYLKRRWLDPRKVLYKHTGKDFTLGNDADKNRTSVIGDPNLHSLNVTISQLRPADTDRYYCEFVVAKHSSEDEHIAGKTEFFLLVTAGECFIFIFFICPKCFTYLLPTNFSRAARRSNHQHINPQEVCFMSFALVAPTQSFHRGGWIRPQKKFRGAHETKYLNFRNSEAS